MMVRKKYQKKEIILAASCILLAVATLTFYIWHQAALINLGYQIGKLEADILRLEEDIKKLETQRAALLSLDRVDKIARDQLSLVEPKEEQVIYEDFKAPDGQ